MFVHGDEVEKKSCLSIAEGFKIKSATFKFLKRKRYGY